MKSNRTGRAIAYGLLILGSVPILIPFLWMVSSSLKTKGHVGDNPPVIVPFNDHNHLHRGARLEEVVLLVERPNGKDKVRTEDGVFLEVDRTQVHKTSAVEPQWSNYGKIIMPKRKGG